MSKRKGRRPQQGRWGHSKYVARRYPSEVDIMVCTGCGWRKYVDRNSFSTNRKPDTLLRGPVRCECPVCTKKKVLDQFVGLR